MKNRFFTLLLVAILSLLFVASSFAGSSIRCGNDLVSVGDLKIQVVNKCGKPISKEKIELDSSKHRRRDNYRFIEQWIYELHHGYYDVLTFKGGKLIKIESMVPK